MGHERTGALPKTKKWLAVVGEIEEFSGSEAESLRIAVSTLENVESRFQSIEQDRGVNAAFKFLTALAVKAGQGSARAADVPGLQLPSDFSPFALARSLHEWLSKHRDSLEYAELAERAVNDALVGWHVEHSRQPTLFQTEPENVEIWRKAGTAGGFCELARLFFAKFTERYLNYFLEREASSSTDSIERRDLLKKQLAQHVDSVSQHAFETAKITQSFAAGWYNNHAKDSFPDDNEILRFLRIAFGKLREDLRRESES